MKLDKLMEVQKYLQSNETDKALYIIEAEINIELAKTKAKKFNIFDFCAGKNEYRDCFKGVYYDTKGFAVATDGSIMVVLPDETRSGKIIGKDGKEIDAEFPKYRSAIPTNFDDDAIHINPEWREKIAKRQKEMHAAKDKTELAVRMNGICYGAKYLSLFLSGCAEIGATEILVRKISDFRGGSYIACAKTEKGTVLCISLYVENTFTNILEL